MLAVSGTLNRDAVRSRVQAADRRRSDGGPQSEGSLSRQAARIRRQCAAGRVYMFHKRVVPYPLLQAFDKPDAQQSCGRRDRTTVAPQALALLNDPFVRTVALNFADRLLKEGGRRAAIASGSSAAISLALGRAPSDVGTRRGQEFRRDADRRERTRRAAGGPPTRSAAGPWPIFARRCSV